MARKNIKVDFGFEPEEPQFKGIVFALDSFDKMTGSEFNELIDLIDDRDFDKLILYPLHEKNLKRMDIEISTSYHNRLKILDDFIQSSRRTFIPISIDNLDGKRKKYTPIYFILTHLTEKHKGPYFLYLTKEVANKFASYSSFDKWIKELRLIVKNDSNEPLHEKLKKNERRIDFI
jgi:nicotinic acid mononucleotide adenylyltransferase